MTRSESNRLHSLIRIIRTLANKIKTQAINKKVSGLDHYYNILIFYYSIILLFYYSLVVSNIRGVGLFLGQPISKHYAKAPSRSIVITIITIIITITITIFIIEAVPRRLTTLQHLMRIAVPQWALDDVQRPARHDELEGLAYDTAFITIAITIVITIRITTIIIIIVVVVFIFIITTASISCSGELLIVLSRAQAHDSIRHQRQAGNEVSAELDTVHMRRYEPCVGQVN